MALVQFADDEDYKKRLPLSISNGKIVTHKEVYQSVDGSLSESLSFSRVIKKLKDGRTFLATQIQVISVHTPRKNLGENDCAGPVPRKKILNFTNNMHKNRIFHKKPQNFPQNDQKIKSSAAYTLKMIAMKTIKYCFYTAIFLSILPFLFSNKCEHVLNVEKLSSDLSINLFGQKEVIAKVSSILTMCNSSTGLYTMVFTGGVGVGKTYTSTIMGQHFPKEMNSLIVDFSKGSDINQMLPSSFSNCGCNLLRVDDLAISDVDKVVNLVLAVKNKMKNDKVILLLIFNVQKYEEKQEILNKFKESSISVFHIPFWDLSEEDVRKCFMVEVEKQKVQISDSELEELVKMKMKFVDVVNGLVGCKGVSEEVSFFSS